MRNSIIIGLTGQTGAGKSTVAIELAMEGCAVLDCDVLARRVIDRSADCKAGLVNHFGQDILDDKGKLNRKLLAERAFRSKTETALLNQATHPYILQAMREEIRALKEQKKRFIVLDAPMLLESGSGDLCDFIIVVTAPEPVRKARIQMRDNLSDAEADARMNAQQPEDFYTHPADFVVDGTMERGNLSRKVRTILKTIEGGYNA